MRVQRQSEAHRRAPVKIASIIILHTLTFRIKPSGIPLKQRIPMVDDYDLLHDVVGWQRVAYVGQEELIWIVDPDMHEHAATGMQNNTDTDSCIGVLDECSSHRKCTVFFC